MYVVKQYKTTDKLSVKSRNMYRIVLSDLKGVISSVILLLVYNYRFLQFPVLGQQPFSYLGGGSGGWEKNILMP